MSLVSFAQHIHVLIFMLLSVPALIDRYIPYCSSDLWSGNGVYNASSPSDEFVFMGSKIFRAVIADLLARTSFAEAEYVVLTGHR